MQKSNITAFAALAATLGLLATTQSPLATTQGPLGTTQGPLGTSAAYAATWSSSEKFGTFSDQGYTIYNNVWGDGAGPQSISADSFSKWSVSADHPNTSGVKSYPNTTKAVDKRISALKSATSDFAVSVPSAGAYTTAYDIWCENNAFEIMLWMNSQGAVGPLGTKQTSATVGGHTWTTYKGTNGTNEVFSFVRTGNTNSGNVDIKAILDWIKGEGWFGDVTVGVVQFGYEITSTDGKLDFTTNSFSASIE